MPRSSSKLLQISGSKHYLWPNNHQSSHPSMASSSTRTTPQHPNPLSNFVSNCLLSSAFLRTPFSPPHFNPHYHSIHELHTSLVSAADRCFTTLHSLASTNPLLQKLHSWSSNLRSFRQIHCRNQSSSNSLSIHNFAAILPGDSVAGLVVANGISNFLNLYNTLLVVRLVLTWFPNSPPAIVTPLSTICDPYLNIFRGLIPPLGGTLDLSPILAFLVLNAFTSTAAALPAELPTTAESQNLSSYQSTPLNLTMAQRKWMKRVCGGHSKTSTGKSDQSD